MEMISGLVCITETTVFISTGDMLQHEDGHSPLHSLEQAAVHYASAIRLSSRDARLHFLLGVILEEQHYATEMYGLQRKVASDMLFQTACSKSHMTKEILYILYIYFFIIICPLKVAFRDPD